MFHPNPVILISYLVDEMVSAEVRLDRMLQGGKEVNRAMNKCRKLWIQIRPPDPEPIGYLGQKVNLLYGNHNFCQQGISQVYPGLQLSHSDHPKKFPFPSYGSFFGAHPCFWPFWASDTTEVQLPLILVRFQRNSGEPGHQKNDPEPSTLSEQALRARALRARA